MEWLERRDIEDLDPRAERALREAGQSFQDSARAEQFLAQAIAIAPEHPAVLLGHYRYFLYKHDYPAAERYARRCLAQVACELGLPSVLLDTQKGDTDFTSEDARVRFWLFGMQALGYVLLRRGNEGEGRACLRKVVEVDSTDQTKTQALLEVIERAEMLD
jgi:hypothetical protein